MKKATKYDFRHRNFASQRRRRIEAFRMQIYAHTQWEKHFVRHEKEKKQKKCIIQFPFKFHTLFMRSFHIFQSFLILASPPASFLFEMFSGECCLKWLLGGMIKITRANVFSLGFCTSDLWKHVLWKNELLFHSLMLPFQALRVLFKNSFWDLLKLKKQAFMNEWKLPFSSILFVIHTLLHFFLKWLPGTTSHAFN